MLATFHDYVLITGAYKGKEKIEPAMHLSQLSGGITGGTTQANFHIRIFFCLQLSA